MQLTQKRSNRIFWILQLLGWGSVNLLSLGLIKTISFEFLVFNVVAGMFAGILVTSLLRYYLKGNLSFDGFGLKEIGKITVSTFITSVMYGVVSIYFGYLYTEYVPFKTETDLQLLEAYNNFWLVLASSLFIIFGWVICYLVIKLLLKLNANRIERLELNTTLKQAQLNTLKGQINPHFMFNSLNNIRGLMLEDVERSREMLTKLSEMLRYSLTKNNVNAIALEEELEMVDNYIELSKVQFEHRLKFVKDIEPAALGVPIPPMIVQLLVENGAKHGISNLKEGGTITLKAQILGSELCIEVKNTGKLQIAKESTQLGLKNIRQRLRLLYADKATFSLNEVEGEVVANIKIPLA